MKKSYIKYIYKKVWKDVQGRDLKIYQVFRVYLKTLSGNMHYLRATEVKLILFYQPYLLKEYKYMSSSFEKRILIVVISLYILYI